MRDLLKARNFFIWRYFSYYEQLKFRAQLSQAQIIFYNPGPELLAKMQIISHKYSSYIYYAQ